LERLLAQREPGRRTPVVMSDAWSSNKAQEAGLSRCHCLAHGRRKFRELAEDFPTERAVVVAALTRVYDHDDEARGQQLSDQERLAYHQPYSGPVLTTLKTWREHQTAQRLVAPTSRLGKAIA
jgi:transposase